MEGKKKSSISILLDYAGSHRKLTFLGLVLSALALIAEMLMSQISASRLREIYEMHTAEGSEEYNPSGHDIEFENVCFAYDDNSVIDQNAIDDRKVLEGVSFVAKEGGVDIKNIDPEILLSDFSIVFQDVVLFDDTVMENIRLGKHGATDEEVIAAAKVAEDGKPSDLYEREDGVFRHMVNLQYASAAWSL